MISKGSVLALLLFCWCLAEGSAWTLPLFAQPRSSMQGSPVANFRSLVQMHASSLKSGDNNITRNNPFRITRKRLEQKLLEVEQQDRLGKKLSQAYCDSILGLCVASDEWDSVLEVLDVMKRQGLKQERSSYRACLHTCFDAGNGASASEILSAMDKAGVEAEPNDIGLTVAAMCRNNISERGWWRKALNMLKHHSKGGSTAVKSLDNVIPVQAYDAVLECMAEEKQWKEAVRLLRLMEKGSSKSTKNDAANGFHPSPALSTYRAVIECCGATYQAEQAVQVIYSMKDRGVKPSTYTCELVISLLSKKLQWRRAIQLLDLMEELNIPKTVVTYNTVISACARSREVGMAKNLLNKMRKEKIRPNEVSFNSVIGACASTARWKDALATLDQCYREPGVTPNIYIYTNAMRACAKGGQTKRALSLLQVVKDKGLPLDSYCYTAVIDACAKGGMWKKALSLLDEMQARDIAPTEVTYSVVISACGNGGQWEKALSLLQLMREQGMSVNLITYNAAITALSKASRLKAKNSAKFSSEGMYSEGLWTRALLLLGQMKKDGIDPDGFCYSSAISCCGAEGRWEEALKLIDVMKQGGPRTRPNKISYTAAISACGRAGEANQALELFQSMKEDGLSADRVAYNTLFSAFRVAGDADKTFELWGEMCGTGSTLPSGAIATAKGSASPDIITVTDCLATLHRAGRRKEIDHVFKEAVARGIVLRGNQLDSQWETDLSGMSIPVASATSRYILTQALELESDNLQDITFITGVGKAQQRRKGNKDDHQSKTWSKGSKTSLRDYLQELLRQDFEPPLESYIPHRAQGTVVVKKETLIACKER